MKPDLSTLIAIEAIKQVKARYCRHLDAEDWDGFRSILTDDATFNAEGHPFDDADQFVAGVVRHHTLAKVRTVHHCHMPEIALQTPASATGIWAMTDYVDRIWVESGQREAFVGYGHYEETYALDDGDWRISSMVLTRLRTDILDPVGLPPFPERGRPVAPVLPG
jgi:hypothetical protein